MITGPHHTFSIKISSFYLVWECALSVLCRCGFEHGHSLFLNICNVECDGFIDFVENKTLSKINYMKI